MVGRLILKVLPWWVFALVALSFVPLSATMIAGTIRDRVEAQIARTSSAPALLPIAQLSPSKITAPLREVHLSGRIRTDVGPWERQQKGVNVSYLIVEQHMPSSTGGPRYILLYFESYLTDLMLERLAARTEANGSATIRGFATDRSVGLPPKTWLNSAVPDGQLQAIVMPYFGTRLAGIDEVASDSIFVTAIGVGFNVIFFAIAAVKFRAWRKRVAIKRGPVVTRAPSPRPAAKPVPTRGTSSKPKPVDDFADGPIQSGKKGWF